MLGVFERYLLLEAIQSFTGQHTLSLFYVKKKLRKAGLEAPWKQIENYCVITDVIV